MIKRHLGIFGLVFFSATALAQDPFSATYRDTQAFMLELANRFPQTTRVVDIGPSDSGAMIQGLMIGNGPVRNLVVATHHGNEYGSTEVAKAFAESVAEAPILGQTLFVIPVVNVSGYDHRERREWKNGQTLDPNRNYPGPCGTEGPFSLQSTASVAQFIDKAGIVSAATLHTFSPAVVYPWGLASPDLSTPYDDIFKMLVQAATVESHYKTGNSTQVVYAANGTFEDFAFWQHGIWAILFEMGHTHSPNLPGLTQLIRENVPGLRQMFQQAPTLRAENHGFNGRCDNRLNHLDSYQE